jgi:uncharacterized hydantoinase/oxoprolinase family protein
MTVGIDIGGANTKAASHDGDFTFHEYAPLWEKTDINGVLHKINQRTHNTEKFGIVVTAELADCFLSRTQGLEWVEKSVKKVIPDALFFGYDGNFHETMDETANFAGANWMASSRFLAGEFPFAI